MAYKYYDTPIPVILEDDSGTMNSIFSEKSKNEFNNGTREALDIVNQVCPIAIR